MNKYIELLMDDLDLKVGEKFKIEGCVFNPYHFDSKGYLKDGQGEINHEVLYRLMEDEETITKLPILTEEEVGMLKGFKMLGYNYVGGTGRGVVRVCKTMAYFARLDWYTTQEDESFEVDTRYFKTVKRYAYTIDELLKINERERRKEND